MGTASQQPHADQPGQHGSEPHALTGPDFLQKLEAASHTGQRGHLQQRGHWGRQDSLNQPGESPQPSSLYEHFQQLPERLTSPPYTTIQDCRATQIHQSAVTDAVQHGDTPSGSIPCRGLVDPHDCNLPRTQLRSISKQYRRS